MQGDKPAKLQSLNQSETEVLHVLFRDPNFKVKELAAKLYRGEGGIRTNLTAIFNKLRVPEGIENKREWVVREYQEAYEYVFQRAAWEAKQASQRLTEKPKIYKNPPKPVLALTNFFSRFKPEIKLPRKIETVIALLLILALAALSVVLWIDSQSTKRLNNDLYKDYVQALSENKQLREGLTNQIIFFDQFDSRETLAQWSFISGEPLVVGGRIQGDGQLSLSAGDNAGWSNYTVYAGIVMFGCGSDESKIGIRLNTPNFIPAFSWNSCAYQSGTMVDVVITVNGNNMTVLENGQKVELREINLPGHEVGGIVIELNQGSALDYLFVVKLP